MQAENNYNNSTPGSPAADAPKEGMMGIIGTNIRFARKKKGMSQTKLAIACGWKKFPSRVSNYERGVREPKSGHLSRLARVLDVSMEWLYRDHGSIRKFNISEPMATYKAIKYIPLLRGQDVVAHLLNQPVNAIDMVPAINVEAPRSFAMLVEGDSMEAPSGISFSSGMTIILDPTVTPENHHFVIAVVDKMPTFKELIIDSGRRWLKPLNSRYPLIEIDHRVEIAGVLKYVFKSF